MSHDAACGCFAKAVSPMPSIGVPCSNHTRRIAPVTPPLVLRQSSCSIGHRFHDSSLDIDIKRDDLRDAPKRADLLVFVNAKIPGVAAVPWPGSNTAAVPHCRETTGRKAARTVCTRRAAAAPFRCKRPHGRQLAPPFPRHAATGIRQPCRRCPRTTWMFFGFAHSRTAASCCAEIVPSDGLSMIRSLCCSSPKTAR
jgi:hypothetical protein